MTLEMAGYFLLSITFLSVCVLKAVALSAVQMQSVFRGLDQHSEEDKLQRLLKLKLRYFTPREVANLMGFPQSFCKSKTCEPVTIKAGDFLCFSVSANPMTKL
uniref:Uncharacterized protein n=1 Tax=Mastacembelus armatus TaxID=205130 RepID=A0A7N8X1G3_9TELE